MGYSVFMDNQTVIDAVKNFVGTERFAVSMLDGAVHHHTHTRARSTQHSTHAHTHTAHNTHTQHTCRPHTKAHMHSAGAGAGRQAGTEGRPTLSCGSSTSIWLPMPPRSAARTLTTGPPGLAGPETKVSSREVVVTLFRWHPS